jgi:hypothetical protein
MPTEEANGCLVSWVKDVLSDGVDEAKCVLGLADEYNAGVGSEPLVGGLDLDGAVEIGLEQVTLSFNHRVVLSVFAGSGFLPKNTGDHVTAYSFFRGW